MGESGDNDAGQTGGGLSRRTASGFSATQQADPNYMWRGGRFGYHLFNLASRSNGATEARILLPDVRSGQLESASKALDQQWAASGATYKHSHEVLINQSISLWKRAGYNRIRFLSVEIDPEEWDLVKCMGAGAEKGCEVAGIESFDDAQAACAGLRKLPAASGARFDLDDLICWLCSSQHRRHRPELSCQHQPSP